MSALPEESSLLLQRISSVAERCVPAGYFDAKIGTWKDNPVGGAAERDGSWLSFDLRKELIGLLEDCTVLDEQALTRRLTADSTQVYMFSEEERFEVKLVALEAGGDGSRSTQPAGSVSLSRVLTGAASTVPLKRLGPKAPWLPRQSSARTRRFACGVWTSLGGPPRETYAEGEHGSLVLEVVLRPPINERINIDGGATGEPTPLLEEDASLLVLASQQQQQAIIPVVTNTQPSKEFNGGGVIGGLSEVVGDLSRRLLASRSLVEDDELLLEDLGVRHARGVLLYGPPGCGKTLLARELASHLGADEDRVFVVNGPELLDKFVGVAEERVRVLFERSKRDWRRYSTKKRNKGAAEDVFEAKRRLAQPPLNVIIFDEMDAICRERGSLSGDTTGVRDSVTAQLLASLDGIEDAGNLIVIGTTNRPELLDTALLRPGRLEVKVRVPPPNAEARKQILDIHTSSLRNSKRISAEALKRLDDGKDGLYANDTAGFNGAELAGLARAMVSSAIARSQLSGTPIQVLAADIDLAVQDIVADQMAARNNAPAAWPELEALEAIWREESDAGCSASEAEAKRFLERLAYKDRRIALPNEASAVDDLAHHLSRYLRRD